MTEYTLRSESSMEAIINCFKNNKYTLEQNANLIDIYDGNLIKYVLLGMNEQLSQKTFEVAKHRVAPINLLKKIIQKLSPIYNPAPARRVVDGNADDQKLFEWYVEKINPNKFFWRAVRQYSLCRSCLLDVVPDKMQPVPRATLNDRFFVLSTDEVDDMRPTHVVMFEQRRIDDKDLWVFYVYTDTEFLIFTEEKVILTAEMAELNNPEGKNRYGVLPFTYATESEAKVYPSPDSDMIAMTKLIPIILSDLNYAIMFQCFSIFYGINIDDKEMKVGPNVLWRLKKDATATGEPEIGVIKGNVDYDGVLTAVQSQLSMWLNSKGIRPGSIGKLDNDNFANGISKMIDEMDTFELRQMLIDTFTVVENQFWHKLLHVQHPLWVKENLIENKTLFSDNAKIETKFSEQQPMYSRGQLVKDLAEEVKNGFTTQEKAIAKLNPLLSEKELADFIAAIKAEKDQNSQLANGEAQQDGNDIKNE